MPISREFVIERNDEYGTTGFRPVNMPYADPLPAIAVAHDLLEHFPKDDGSIEAELMALGASLFVRSENYYASKGQIHTNPGENIGGDFPGFMGYLIQSNRSLVFCEPGRTTKLDENVEGYIDVAIMEGRKNLHDYDGEAFLDDEQARRARGWLRRGYRKAVKRYHEHRQHSIEWLFMQVEDEAQKTLEEYEEYIGTQVTFYANPSTGEVRVKVDLDEEW